MLDKIIDLDTQIFLYLNGLGSEKYDAFWLFITHQTNWTPLFLLLLFLVYKQFCWKQTIAILLFVGLLALLTDQTSNLFKNGFERLRPNNNPLLMDHIRVLKTPQSFSFISGHASNSTAVTTFLCLLFYKRHKWIWVLYTWPFIFAYSRIYLGVHFPLDIICGFIWGALMGFLMYKVYSQLWRIYKTKP